MLRSEWPTMRAKYSWGVSKWKFGAPRATLVRAATAFMLFALTILIAPQQAFANDDQLAIDEVRISASVGQSHKVEMQGTFKTDFSAKQIHLDLVTFGPLQTRSQLDDILNNPNLNQGTIHSEVSTLLNDIGPESSTNWQLKFNGEKILGSNASGVYVFGVIKRGSNLQANYIQPWFFKASKIKKTKVIFLTQLAIQNSHLADGRVRFINRDAKQLSRINDLADSSAKNITFLKDKGIDSWIADLQKSALLPAADEVAQKLSTVSENTELQVFNHTNLQGLFKSSPGDVGAVLRQSGFSSGQDIFYLPKYGQIDSPTLSNLANFGNIIPILSNTFVLGAANRTSSAIAKVNGVPSIVYDVATSRCFSKTIIADVTRCLEANIAMITAESPFESRTVAILTPPYWSADTNELSTLVNAISANHSGQVVPLGTKLSGDIPTNHYLNGPLKGFPKGLLGQANRLLNQAEVLGSAINDDSFLAGYESVRLRSFSELFPKAQSAKYFLRTNKELLEKTRSQISISTSSRITVASTKTDIPLTISNQSNYPIRVKALLTSDSASQFKSVATDLIDVPSNQRVTVSVTVKLAGTGNVPVTVNLLNPKNQRLKVSQNIALTSSSYQSLARTLVWGACGLLLLFAIVNVARKRWGESPNED